MGNIIGATAFHGPVRDGKGWGHRAMVVRHKRGSEVREEKSVILASDRNSEEVKFGQLIAPDFTVLTVIGSSRTGN